MSVRVVEVVAAAIVVGNKCLVGKRPAGGSFGELWEFPGGKIEAGETHEQALRREIGEELGVDVAMGAHLGGSRFETTIKTISLNVYLTHLSDPTVSVRCREHIELRYVGVDELTKLAWAPPDIFVLARLAEALETFSHHPLPNVLLRGD